MVGGVSCTVQQPLLSKWPKAKMVAPTAEAAMGKKEEEEEREQKVGQQEQEKWR